MKFFTQRLSEQYLKQVNEESLYVLSVQQQKLAGRGEGAASGQQFSPAGGECGSRAPQSLN